jgi:SAM-dependent methyltransferase
MEWYEEFYTNEYIDVVGFASDEQTRRETGFIQEVLKLEAGAKILDLCCGYGRHSRLLAQSGSYEVVGLDLSENYLDIARQADAGSNVEFIKGDMRDIPFKQEFDAVLNLFTSFGFFETDRENEDVIRQVNKSLKDQGLFLLDYENKFYFVFNDVYRKEKAWQAIDGDKYVLFENKYDVFTEREQFRAAFYENGKITKDSGYDIRLYNFPEISAMLERGGFEVVDVWGNYSQEIYSTRSKRLIILAKKIKEVFDES